MFDTGREKAAKWLLFTIIVGCFLCGASCIFFPVLGFYSIEWTPLYCIDLLMGFIIPFPGIFSAILAIVALIGWFLLIPDRTAGRRILLIILFFALAINAITFIVALIPLFSGPTLSYLWVTLLPSLVRVGLSVAAVALLNIWRPY